MHLWTKLSPAKSLNSWEDRLHGEPNLVLNLLPGGKSVRVQVYCQSAAQAAALHQRFGGSVQFLKHADWSVFSKPPRPVKIRDRLLVVAEVGSGGLAQLEREYPGREVLVIPAERAFGTGEHATTASCLRLLVDIARERGWRPGGHESAGTNPPGRAADRRAADRRAADRRAADRRASRRTDAVADLGTGSGVLAVAAKQLGAASVWACDFDPQAVAVARRNVARNRVEQVEVAECDVLQWRPPRCFDVLLANLFSTVLIEAMPVLAAALAPGGDLVVSGVLRSQGWAVAEAAAAHGLGFSRVVRRGKWLTARGGWLADMMD